MITLTIDGKQIAANAEDTILQAASKNDIRIPTLCYYKKMSPIGSCRVCVVEVEGADKPMAACTSPALDGMVVHTQTERVVELRRMAIRMMLLNHRLDCHVCEASGACALQDLAFEYNVEDHGFGEVKVERDVGPYATQLINYHPDKCVMCLRCVHACKEVKLVEALSIGLRGILAHVKGDQDRCISCGECWHVCPVGALTQNLTQPPMRIHQMEKEETTCSYCGVGCQMELRVANGKVWGVTTDDEKGPNKGSLCVKGRFGFDFIDHPDRLKTPLIKENGQFREASWDEAFGFAAEQLIRIRKASGPDSIMGFTSARCTNEENYLFQKFMRAGVGTNNVDHCARLCHASTVAGLAAAFGSGAMTNSIQDIGEADCILISGSNTSECHPIIGDVVRTAAQRKGAKLLVVEPREIPLAKEANIFLQPRPGTDVAWLNGMMHVIWKEGLWDREFIEQRTENLEALVSVIENYTPERVEAITGIPADKLVRAARMYGSAERAAFLYAMGLTQHTSGTDNVKSVANLAMLTGNIGRPGTGVNPLRGQNNVQGACDMGGLPEVYPGYQKVVDPTIQAKFEQAWGARLSPKPGLTLTQIGEKIAAGDIKALYIMGENPLMTDADLNHLKKELEQLEFVIVQDIFLTDTAQLADVVFPSSCFAEKDGTFTNTERRVQRVRKAVQPPGESREDWRIIAGLSNVFGYPMKYESAEDIFQELASLTPSYGGISFERLEKGGIQWPCPAPDHPGTQVLHASQFARGRGLFHAIEYLPPHEESDVEYPYTLTTGRYYEHYHTGTMTRRSKGLDLLCPEGYADLNPEDAAHMSIIQGDRVKLKSRRGQVEIRARLREECPKGVVFAPFHFNESMINQLTNSALDPIAKIPEFKVCAVAVEKAR